MTIEMKEYYVDTDGEKRHTIIVEGYFKDNRSTSRFIDELIKEYNLEESDYYLNDDHEACVVYTGNNVVMNYSTNHEYEYEYELILTGLES